jgi:lysophospholipase L1-like esterase
VRAAEALGGRVADGDGATARAFAADHRLFSADRFHPSSAGYAVIASALLPQVLAAQSASPSRESTRPVA